MNYKYAILKIIVIMVFLSKVNTTLYAQNKCELKEFPELFKSKKVSKEVKDKKQFFFVLPYLGYQPATGFSYGAISQYIFKGKR